MNLRSRAKRLFGREALSEHTVRASRVDHAVFSDLRKRASKVDEIVSAPPTLPDGSKLDGKVWERLSEDLWSEFYGDDEPALRARDKIDPRYRVNRELAGKQARDDSFRETRSMTRGQVTESALGLMGALGSLAKSYGDELAEHGKRENEIAKAEDDLDAIDDVMDKLRELRADGIANGKNVDEADEKMRALGAEKHGRVTALQAAVSEQSKHAGDLVDAAAVAIGKATEKASDAIRATSLLPGSGAGRGSSVSPDMMIEFANRVQNSAVLGKVLEMMGRLELSMGTTRRQLRKGGYEEMVDIEMGDDLRLILPSEKALLTHPVAQFDFYRRLHERSLMQYEMWSEQELKRGPVIFAADGSGSMQGVKNVFARGLTLASCSIGNREKRNTAAIEFGAEGQLREFFFPGDRPLDTGIALDFAEHFYGGGTKIDQVLARAYELIHDEAPFHTADLVIVTDGGDRVTEATIVLRDQLRDMGVKIHGLAIGMAPTPYLLTVCDNTSSVLDFAGPNDATDRIAIDLS